MNWKNQVVWITGASSGIGESLVKELAKAGALVILSSRNKSELERVKKEAGLDDQTSLILPLDLEEYHNLSKSVPQALKKWGRVDVLINNGGVSQRALAENTSIEVTEKIMRINFFGSVALTVALYPHMKSRKEGIIAVVSSVAGKVGTGMRTTYCASKHALQGYYDGLRAEAYHDGIQVSIICPGYIKTKISNNALLGNGKIQNKMDDGIASGLDVTETAKRILAGLASGKDEILISGPREKLATYLKRFAPGLLSRILRNAKVT
jgi:short-subunit dehydrogenase